MTALEACNKIEEAINGLHPETRTEGWDWCYTKVQSDSAHLADHQETLEKTRAHFSLKGDTSMWFVGTHESNTILANCGNSPTAEARSRCSGCSGCSEKDYPQSIYPYNARMRAAEEVARKIRQYVPSGIPVHEEAQMFLDQPQRFAAQNVAIELQCELSATGKMLSQEQIDAIRRAEELYEKNHAAREYIDYTTRPAPAPVSPRGAELPTRPKIQEWDDEFGHLLFEYYDVAVADEYIGALEAEIARLTKYREWRNKASTHWEGCWDSHYDCAMSEIARLTALLAAQEESK